LGAEQATPVLLASMIFARIACPIAAVVTTAIAKNA